jgi:hypothetical protein
MKICATGPEIIKGCVGNMRENVITLLNNWIFRRYTIFNSIEYIATTCFDHVWSSSGKYNYID